MPDSIPASIQDFVAESTRKAAEELKKAFLELPEDRRDWKPSEKSRSALNVLVECAVMNAQTVPLIETVAWPSDGVEAFERATAEVGQDWQTAIAVLEQGTEKLVNAIRAVSPDQFGAIIEMPWQPFTLLETINYPSWNMSYHLGQINYISSLLD
jgi:hypothetical protein